MQQLQREACQFEEGTLVSGVWQTSFVEVNWLGLLGDVS